MAPVAVLLAIEFFDELVFGAREAAWPLIRHDLGLSYPQIGLVLALPSIVGALIEPFLALLGDSGWRRVVVVVGGCAFGAELLVVSGAGDIVALIVAFAVLGPWSGAFVSLSQASLMDHEPGTRERNMARWVLAGSFGVVVGPLVIGAAVRLGLGWRGAFVGFAMLVLPLVLLASRLRFAADGEHERTPILATTRRALHALADRDVLRWLLLLELTDLMGDVLLGFLALYFVDVARTSPAIAGAAIAVWGGAGLAGDALLLLVLRRIDGVRYLRSSAAIVLVVFPAFLLVPGPLPKLGLVGAIALLHAGWYAIPKAKLYDALHGASGTAVALNNIGGLLAGAGPFGVGLLAQHAGLSVALWPLLLGPISLLVGLPRSDRARRAETASDPDGGIGS